jgi:hypothetical protein
MIVDDNNAIMMSFIPGKPRVVICKWQQKFGTYESLLEGRQACGVDGE